MLKNRKPNSHKGDYGKVLVVAGSKGMLGAGVLATRGALRVGAGLVYWAVPEDLVNYANRLTPEVIVLDHGKIKTIKADVLAIGPGLGISEATSLLLHTWLTCDKPLVLDADALNTIAADQTLINKLKQQHLDNVRIVLTPHPAELGRLLNKDVTFIQKHRAKVAVMAAVMFNSIVVLKGHETVVAHPSRKKHLNKTGNPGMATAGTGDVLTGMIAGLIAQGFSPWEAAKMGVSLHGLAGDLAAKEKGEAAMIASDLVERIPNAIQNSH